MQNKTSKQGTSVLQIIKSVAAAAFGVQSRANRERDFTHGKASHFIIAGILGTLLFLAAIGLLVKLALSSLS